MFGYVHRLSFVVLRVALLGECVVIVIVTGREGSTRSRMGQEIRFQ